MNIVIRLCMYMLLSYSIEYAFAGATPEVLSSHISGTVIDNANSGTIASVGLFCTWCDDNDHMQITQTDSNGYFQFNGIATGVYQVVVLSCVNDAHYKPIDNVSISEGVSVTNIRLSPTEYDAFDLHVMIIEERTGAVISNAQVSISFENPVAISDVTTFLRTFTSHTNNVFLIKSIYPGRYFIAVHISETAKGICALEIKHDGKVVFDDSIQNNATHTSSTENTLIRFIIRTVAGSFETQTWLQNL